MEKDPRRFDAAMLWSVVKLSPLFILFAYVAGYVVDLSYLGTFGIHYIGLVNSTFMKAGLLVLGLFSPVVYAVYSNFAKPTDNMKVNYKQWPGILGVSIPWSVILSFAVTSTNLAKASNLVAKLPGLSVTLLVLMIQVLSSFYATSYAARELPFRTKSWLIVVPALTLYVVSLVFGTQPARVLLILFGFAIIMSHIFIGTYGDRKLAVVGPIVAALLFFGACSYFGRYTYEYISPSIGGMQPYTATLIVTNQFQKTATELALTDGATAQIRDATILFEDSDIYVFRHDGTVYLFEKSQFAGLSVAQ